MKWQNGASGPALQPAFRQNIHANADGSDQDSVRACDGTARASASVNAARSKSVHAGAGDAHRGHLQVVLL